MRLLTTIVLTLVALCMASKTCTAGPFPAEPPKYYLTDKDLANYKGLTYTQQILKLPKGSASILIITRNFGSGFELRDAYIYMGGSGAKDDRWNQISYIMSGSPRITGELTDKDIILKSADDKVLLSIPIESLESPN
jgi:hypothetical protein